MENTQQLTLNPVFRIKKRDIIKHAKFKDVACLVEHIYIDGTVCIRWINQGFVESWLIRSGVDWIKIDEDWLKCDNPKIRCLRRSTWSKI